MFAIIIMLLSLPPPEFRRVQGPLVGPELMQAVDETGQSLDRNEKAVGQGQIDCFERRGTASPRLVL